MNRFPNSSVEIDENELYYFLTLQNDRFNTGFVGWLTEDLVYALTEYFTTGDPTAAYYQIKMNIGKNRFLIDSNQPLYLLSYENDAAFEFAGDSGELEIFPGGNVPTNLSIDPYIDFPSFWHKEVESMLEFKIAETLYQNRNGVWTPLET